MFKIYFYDTIRVKKSPGLILDRQFQNKTRQDKITPPIVLLLNSKYVLYGTRRIGTAVPGPIFQIASLRFQLSGPRSQIGRVKMFRVEFCNTYSSMLY